MPSRTSSERQQPGGDTAATPPLLRQICSDLEIEILPTTARRGPGQTCAAQTMERILADHGQGHLTIVLRSIVETQNNRGELVAPVIWAINDIVLAHPGWVQTGLKWLEALDSADLSSMRARAKANRRAAQPRQAIATMLFDHLRLKFDSPAQGRML